MSLPIQNPSAVRTKIKETSPMTQEITAQHLDDKIILTFLAPFSFDELNTSQPVPIPPHSFPDEAWQMVSAGEYDDFTKGSAVFDSSKPASLTWKVAGKESIHQEIVALLSDKADAYFGAAVKLKVLDWHLVGMNSNIIISSCMLELDCRWDIFLRAFPAIRDPFCTDLRDILVEHLKLLQPSQTQLAFPYFHVLISGQLKSEIDRAQLDNSFRPILYPETNAPIESMSPHPQEFIFLGYAFSLILCPDSALQRTAQVLPLIEYTSGLYRELAMASDFAQQKIIGRQFKKDTEIHDVKNDISIMYHEFVSPTFTYTHEMLVLRDGLLATWRVSQLLSRANFLMTQLDLQIKEWHKEREKKWAKRINTFLFVITVSTLISVIYDATMMARAFDFLKTTAIEAWENLFVK